VCSHSGAFGSGRFRANGRDRASCARPPHSTPSIGEELSSSKAAFDDGRAGSGCAGATSRTGLGGRRPGRLPSWSNRQADDDVNEPDRGDRSHCGPDYLPIDGSRRCYERFPTSRRAVQLDLGYRFLLCLVVDLIDAIIFYKWKKEEFQ
jgi:hypothetical protein